MNILTSQFNKFKFNGIMKADATFNAAFRMYFREIDLGPFYPWEIWFYAPNFENENNM